jgi:hypothetical protein
MSLLTNKSHPKSAFFRNFFGVYHQKYADVLLDYGFLLLHVDSIKTSVAVYEVSTARSPVNPTHLIPSSLP